MSSSIAEESREVFFETNKIHIRPDQVLDLLYRHGQDVRQLHIEARSAESGLHLTEYYAAAETLTRYKTFAPRLKVVTYECTGLRHETVRELVHHLIQIVKFFQCDTDLNIDNFRCIGVGIYTLHIPKTSQEWRFSYTLLAELWDSWSRQQADFQPSLQDMEDYFSSCGAVRIPQWVYEATQMRSVGMRLHNLYGLGALVGRYNDVETILPSLKPQSAQLGVLRRFELIGNWKIKRSMLRSCLEFAGTLELRDVRSNHGAETLEWATELLAPNMKDFAAEFGQSIEEAEEYVRRCKSW